MWDKKKIGKHRTKQYTCKLDGLFLDASSMLSRNILSKTSMRYVRPCNSSVIFILK